MAAQEFDEESACDRVRGADHADDERWEWLTNDLTQWQIHEVGRAIDDSNVGIFQGFVDMQSREIVYLYDSEQIARDEAASKIDAWMQDAQDSRINELEGIVREDKRSQQLVDATVALWSMSDEVAAWDLAAMCVSEPDLQRVAAEVLDAAQRLGFTIAANIDRSRAKVAVHGEDAARINLAPWGSLVEVHQVVVTPRAGDRADDTSPHYGGAVVWAPDGNCTAGYTARRPNGLYYMTTAAHCASYQDNVPFLDGTPPGDFGTTTFTTPIVPLTPPGPGAHYDFTLLRGNNRTQRYSRYIWRAGSNHALLLTSARGGNAIGTVVCQNGAVTSQDPASQALLNPRCRYRITHRFYTAVSGGFKADMVLADEMHGLDLFFSESLPGDSGGTIYSQISVPITDARVHGILTDEVSIAQPNLTAVEDYLGFYSQDRIQAETGGEVARAGHPLTGSS